MFGTVKKTHEEATAYCQKLGGFLAEPRTKEINTAVESFNYSSYYWIGIIYHAERASYCWQTDRAALDYTDWFINEPHQDSITQCGVITRVAAGNNQNKTWKVMDCNYQYAYLCQSNKSEFFQAIFLSC